MSLVLEIAENADRRLTPHQLYYSSDGKCQKDNSQINYALNSVFMSLRNLRILSNPWFAVITSSLDKNSNTWKLLLHILPNGLRLRFTLLRFAVPSALLAARRPTRSGLIADRQYTPSPTAASGKNFTAARVAPCGGLGVAIGLLRNLCVRMRTPMGAPMMIFRVIFDFIWN